MRATHKSLERLYHRYNQLFFSGCLPRFVVNVCRLDKGIKGDCNPCARTIAIDLEQHDDEADVRSTLAHQMLHIEIFGHGAEFWREAERILTLGAPTGLVAVDGDAADGLAAVFGTESSASEHPFLVRAMRRHVRALRDLGIVPSGPQYVAFGQIPTDIRALDPTRTEVKPELQFYEAPVD